MLKMNYKSLIFITIISLLFITLFSCSFLTNYKINITTNGNGTVKLDPTQELYEPNTEVTLEAIADEGWLFKSWEGDVSGKTNPIDIIVDSNKDITANFTQMFGIEPIDDITVVEGTNINFPVNIVNPNDISVKDIVINGDLVEYYNAENNEFDWTPDISDTGTYEIEFTLEDNSQEYDYTVTETVNIQVQPLKMERVSAGTTSQDNGELSLDHSLYVGKYEVTFDDFDKFCEDINRDKKTDKWGRGDMPVNYTSWIDAVEYCNWLSKKEGLKPAYIEDNDALGGYKLRDDPENVEGYRLPTKNEWQYAARGGKKGEPTVYSGSDNINEVAWWEDNSGGQTHPVGEKEPNELGLYDMSGNLFELTNTESDNEYYRLGGAWNAGSEKVLKVDFVRFTISPDSPSQNIGFRVVKTDLNKEEK